MEIILTMLMTGALCALCFTLGARVGQKVSKGEEVTLPEINPMKAAQEHRAKKEAEMEQNRIETIMRNIEGYDGTAFGQEDVPGR